MENTRKTHMISIVEKDDEGHIQGGIKFWWTEGALTYLYQEWEHAASGAIFTDVKPDPIYRDLLTTVKESWLEQVGMEIHMHDPDFR